MKRTGRRGDGGTGSRPVLAAILLLVAAIPLAGQPARPLVAAVDSVGMTVADMDRSVAFYSKVLDFEKVSDVEVAGSDYERLEGVFGLRMRVVRMRLGEESIELSEYLAPRGRPIPEGLRSNDRSFQHIAIIVRDMDPAYRRLRENRVAHLSSGPQRLPDWNKNAGGIQAFYFADPDGHPLEILAFPPEKGAAKWHRPTGSSSESTTRRSSWRTPRGASGSTATFSAFPWPARARTTGRSRST